MHRPISWRISIARVALLALAACLGVSVLASAAGADPWPGWRGAKRDGVSQEKGLLAEWPKEGPKLLWQVTENIGQGFGAPAVSSGRIYLLSNEGTDKEYVQALDATNGKRLWATPLGKVGNPNQQPSHPAARSTPTLDGSLLYALSSDGDLACLDAASGAIRWKKSLRTDFGGQPGNWAYAESPLIDGGKVVCTPGGADATLVALNKTTGEVIWKAVVPGGSPAAYGSVIPVQAAGVRQYAQIVGKGLVGVDAATGKFLWLYAKMATNPVYIPTPVAGADCVYTAGRPGGGLVQLKAAQGGVEAAEVYMNNRLPNAIGGSVKVGDCLYGATNQSMLCVDFATGAVKWEDKALGAASTCFADGRLYLHGENGDVALVEATPEGYREKGRFTPPNAPNRGGDKAWAYPVVSDGRLYIRDLGILYCYDVRAVK